MEKMNQPIIGVNTEPNLLSHILAVHKVLQQDNGIEALGVDSPDVKALVEKLHISPVQAVLFSIVLNGQNDQSVSAADVAKSIKTSPLMIYQYQNDFDSLVEQRLFRKYQGYPGKASSFSSKGESSIQTYRVPKNVIEVLSHNEEWDPPSHKDLAFEDFFEALDDLFEQRINEVITFDTLRFEVSHLLDDNHHLEFVRKVKELALADDDWMLLLIICNQAVDEDQNISYQTINSIFDTRSHGVRIWRQLVNEKSQLQESDLIESENYQGLGDGRTFVLTQKAKGDLLGEISTITLIGKNPKGLISYKDIKPKELIYNETERDKISKLQRLLEADQFQTVRSRLEANNMRLGFACLFSGEPGTGKTETALQIARLTERDIVKVDIADLKTKWFGESEKKVKDIFDRYKGLVKAAEKNNENIPILFFNEADGIFSKRQVISGERTGPAQTENAIQNIILDELENLDGILIATTNLTINLDDAFERRFLYKIEFSKPDKDSRKAIWESMVGELSDYDAAILASEYQFSGGQIENIARKRAVDMILTGEKPSLEDMMSMCRDEKLVKETSKKIGFGV
jgi:AAA+ superfamily predicted ATPase